jgi:hypothetical protein
MLRKNKIEMSRTEWTCALCALNALRNRYIAEGRSTDTIDGVILKIAKAPVRKVKITA